MSQSEIQDILRTWAKQQSAEMRPMGRLVRRYKSAGENMHWHITGLRTGMGTVEVTYISSIGSLTVLVHDNRRGFWAGKAFGKLAQEIKETVGSSK
jgi:Uri superfamily endonuclease